MSASKATLPAVSKLFSSRLRIAALLAFIAFLVYANTFSNGYVLDDATAITNNSLVTRGIAAVPEILRTPYLHGALQNPNDLYRPLSLVMFAVEHDLFGESPGPSHVINVLVFCGCVILLFFFLDLLFEEKKRSLAFITTLLFALHPIHTEVVANIKSRDELLCFFFGFWALLLWLRYVRNGKVYLLFTGSALFILSLLSKETSLCFLLLVPVLFSFWERSPRLRSMHITTCVIGAIGLALIIRFSVLNAYGANHPFIIPVTENSLAAAKTISERLATVFRTLGIYLKLLLVPYPLRCDYSYNTIPLTGFGDWRVFLSLGVYLAMLVAGISLLLKRLRDVYALGILFFLITLALFANIFFLVGATMAERFLFLPSVGFCLVVAQLISRLAEGNGEVLSNKKVCYALIPVALVWGALTIQRNSVWKDAYTLYKTDLAHTPNNYRLPYYLGSTIINTSNEYADDTAKRMELLREAIGYIRQSIAVYPYFNTTQSQAGVTYTNLGMYDSAERYNLNALALNSRDTFSRNNLAAVYFKEGRYHESIAQCRIIVGLYPNFARSYTNIGACYLRLGIPDSATVVLHKALKLEPDNQQAAYFLSVANGMMGVKQ